MKFIKHQLTCLLLTILLLAGSSNVYGSDKSLLSDPLEAEYSLKAAFIVNFARLTHWPDSLSGNINLCIMGNPSMQNAFKYIEQKQVNGKRVKVTIINRDKDILNCQILFISDISHSKIRKLYSYARNYPVLTISEVEDINRSGAIINFVQINDKIRFQINLKYARQAGLKLSSRLLKLAIISH